MPVAEVVLDQAGIEKLDAEGKLAATGKAYLVWDPELSGFGISVSARGSRSWVIQYRLKGAKRDTRVVMGPLTLFRPRDARKLAIHRLAGVKANNVDPGDHRVEAIDGDDPTVAEAIAEFDKVIETEPARRDGKQWKPSSVSNYRQYRARVEDLFGEMVLSSITTEVIRDTLLPTIRTKPPTARRIKWILGAVITWAAEHGYTVGEVNWSAIRIKPANKITTTLTPPEIKSLIDRCAYYWTNSAEQTLSRSARTLLIELALWTGKRQEQLCKIEIDHIFDSHIWISEKTREEGDIILSPAIKDIIDRAKVLRGASTSPLLFPQLVNGKGERTDSINEMFKLYCRQVDIWRETVDPKTRKRIKKTPTMHDLRRTYASVAFRSGLDSLVTAHLIGHSDDEVTKEYYLHFEREMLAGAQLRVSRTMEMIAAGQYNDRLTPILVPSSVAERLAVKAKAEGHETVEAWLETLTK